MGESISLRENQGVKAFSHKEEEEDAALQALLASYSQIYSSVLNAAFKLDLFGIIAQGSSNGKFMSPSDIASRLPTQHADTPQRLDRMLRLLASHSLLTYHSRINEDGNSERVYGLSKVGKYLVRDADGASYSSISDLISHPAMLQSWQHLNEIIVEKDEDLFNKVHGKPLYKHFEVDPTFKNVFQKAMADMSTLMMRKILENYKGFEGISSLVDVAGGIGQTLKMIISKYPSIKGINFDLPQVIETAPSYPGIEHVGGDMFRSVPKGDAIMMKYITHNWTDEKCLQFLSNCHEALKKGGKLIVIDEIVPETPDPTNVAKHSSLLDNIMFIQAGGRERTEKEFEALCKGAGFSEFKVACRIFSGMGVMEFYK